MEEASELEYLTWFCINADFGPANGDVIAQMDKSFEQETGKKVPLTWRSVDE